MGPQGFEGEGAMPADTDTDRVPSHTSGRDRRDDQHCLVIQPDLFLERVRREPRAMLAALRSPRARAPSPGSREESSNSEQARSFLPSFLRFASSVVFSSSPAALLLAAPSLAWLVLVLRGMKPALSPSTFAARPGLPTFYRKRLG